MTPPDLAAAVRASLASRDPAPFDAAAAALWPVLHRAALRGARDHHLAEDAVQDAILAGRATLDALRDHDRAVGWLCGIAHGRGRDLRRAQAIRGRLEDAASRREGDTGPTAAPEAPLSSPVVSALSRLTSAERGAAELVLLGGGTIRAYSVAAGITLGAAKVRTTRARAHLRRLLAPAL